MYSGNWQWCGGFSGPPSSSRRGASCAVPGGRSGWSSARSGCTWTAWRPCACGSGASARRNGRTATRNPPRSICTASHLERTRHTSQPKGTDKNDISRPKTRNQRGEAAASATSAEPCAQSIRKCRPGSLQNSVSLQLACNWWGPKQSGLVPSLFYR